MNRTHRVALRPSGRQGQVPEGTNLRAAIRGLGVDIESVCAENATCGKCKVIIEDGEFPDLGIASAAAHLSPANQEELAYLRERAQQFQHRGWRDGRVRLACQAKVMGDLVVTIPEESLARRQIVRKSARERTIQIKPVVRKYLVELSPPSLSNPKADWERLASGVATSMELVRYGEQNLPKPTDLSIDYDCLKKLPETLRDAEWRVTVTVRNDREVIRVQPGYEDRLYGAAADIGTTTLALYLCDLTTGEVLATESDINPQIPYGEDVMTRIQVCRTDPDGLANLHKAIIRSLNQLLVRAAASAGIESEDVVDLTVVGNTTMMHLLLEIPPANLGVAPFAPAIYRALDVRARELRLAVNRAANVHILPSIAAFIGADTTGVLLAEAPYDQDEVWLIIDIGTNAELVLGNRHGLLCASTPTGPALEGAHIEHGMRAASGAIEHLEIDARTLRARWKLIGEDTWDSGRPLGLCGSAVVDAVAELVRAGAIDSSGKLMTKPGAESRIRRRDRGMEYVVAFAEDSGTGSDICLTQQDIRQIQLAKAALFVAAEALIDKSGGRPPDKILLAGAFGSFIDKANAVSIGMLPSLALERIFVIGNAAGDGARIALLNLSKRSEGARIATQVTRYELPADPGFQERFLRAVGFPVLDSSEKGKNVSVH